MLSTCYMERTMEGSRNKKKVIFMLRRSTKLTKSAIVGFRRPKSFQFQ